MPMKFDLLMWTYNGEQQLKVTLPRINSVIPPEAINRKIASDDNSTDATRDLLEQYGWEVHLNPNAKGVGFNANNALSNATTEFVMCFEQDIFLADNWFKQLVARVGDPASHAVALFTGTRVPNIPIAREFQAYRLRQYKARGVMKPAPIDQTIIRRGALIAVGGFPELAFSGVDSLLTQKFEYAGWKRFVDFGIISDHLRESIQEELKHYYAYGRDLHFVDPKITARQLWAKCLSSPLRAVAVAWATRDWHQLWYYPAIRKAIFDGFKNA